MKNIIRLVRYDWPLHFLLMFTNWMPDNIFILRFRGAIVRPFFKKCGKNLLLGRNVTFYNCSNISIGTNVAIAIGNWFMASNSITLEDEVTIGPYCVFVDATHSRGETGSFRFGKDSNAPIVIGNGTWIAAHVVISAGVSVGCKSLIVANAVVIKSVPEWAIVAGNPAKVLRSGE